MSHIHFVPFEGCQALQDLAPGKQLEQAEEVSNDITHLISCCKPTAESDCRHPQVEC